MRASRSFSRKALQARVRPSIATTIPKTFIVEAGTVGDTELEAEPGDIVVVEAGIPHAFVSLGPDLLVMVCIHAAERMSATWLDGRS